MKQNFTIFILFIYFFAFSQKTEKITVPQGVIYNYAESKINEKAKKLIEDGFRNNDNSLLQSNLMIGPTLWKRFKDKENLKNLSKKVEFYIDNITVDSRMSQNIEDSKKIWDELKNEAPEDFKIRKANESELKYYWATISFDIEEPLYILETKNHNYILNFLKKDLKLFWIDEFPIKSSYYNPIENSTYKTDGEFKAYQNGNEVHVTDKGNKETKLEKVVLLNSDSELQENSSAEDIQEIIEKTNEIFENLFKNSQKTGKIMVQFELGKKKNEIQFAVKDDLDLKIMKEFEKQINKEKYPNSKKNSVKFQLIYKVNSYNDTE